MRKLIILLVLFIATFMSRAQQVTQIDRLLDNSQSAGSFPLFSNGKTADLLVDANDDKTVVMVNGLFADDVERVTGHRPAEQSSVQNLSAYCVIAGSIEKNQFIQTLIQNKQIDVSAVRDKWESCLIQVVDHPFNGVKKALVIAGSDRRGTSYGLLEISKQIGVSPWYYFADVPVQQHKELRIKKVHYIMKSPSVQYRGIFINDEMWGIRPWAEKTLAPAEGKGLGPTAYRKIFELLLRLKANYCWPAMHLHTRPFNDFEGNKLVADSFAIVMGSSHIEPMLRNNMAEAEWDEAYPGEDFNYVTNRDHIYHYWEDRVKQNGKYENIYTLGKRGKDDEPGKEVNVPVLEQVINDQRAILKKWVNPDISKVPQILIPYTEVLNLYNQGLKVPEDVTIVWPDDNFGYIRQLPNKEEQKRSGGSGIYYHFQWLNGATTAYPWLYTTSLGLTWSELKKAYDYNARKLWIVNVGDIKPYEIGIEYFMQMAWDVNRFGQSEPRTFLIDWATRDFGAAYAARIADIIERHLTLSYARRPEQMMMFAREVKTWDWFSTTDYNDEAQRRVNEYDRLIKEVDELYQSLPVAKKDAFYEMVLYNVKCTALQNKKNIYGQKSHLYGEQQRSSAAHYAGLAREADSGIHAIIDHYNKHLVVAGSKWNYMASLPGPWGAQWHQWDMPPISDYSGKGPASLQFAPEGAVAGQLPGFSFYNRDKRFIDLYNKGAGQIKWTSHVSDSWIKLSENAGSFTHEKRIWVSIDWANAPKGKQLKGYINFKSPSGTEKISLDIFNPSSPTLSEIRGFVESNGYVSMEAEHYTAKQDKGATGWRLIKGLGRNGASVTVLPSTIPADSMVADIHANSPLLEYNIYFFTTDSVNIRFNCIPAYPINHDYKSRLAVSIDDGPMQIISATSGKRSVYENLMTMNTKQLIPSAGQHTLKVWMVDPGVVIDKIVVQTGDIPNTYLGPPESFHR